VAITYSRQHFQVCEGAQLSLRIFRGIDSIATLGLKNMAVTIGTFDGVHAGHQKVLAELSSQSRANRLRPIVVTFDPHPRTLTSPDNVPPSLATFDEKVALLSKYFDGDILVLEFNHDLMNMSADKFAKEILANLLGAKALIVGSDHAFGKDRSGHPQELNEFGRTLGFSVSIVEPAIMDGKPISSTRIRQALLAGDLESAHTMLGHRYPISGAVERGLGLGRKLGYPTANIHLDRQKLLPQQGVYSCCADLDGRKLRGMMFIGDNYLNPERRITVEANLFDFDEDIYSRTLTVYPGFHVRGNQRFQTTEDLIAQISEDKRIIMKRVIEEKQYVSDQRAKSSHYC
jgi:riboflavin kinase / FMN adenylyltransferase